MAVFSSCSTRYLGGWQPLYGIPCPPCGHRHMVLEYVLPASIISPRLLCLYVASQLTCFRRTVSSEDFVVQANWKGRADPYVNTQKAWCCTALEGHTLGNNTAVIKLITCNTARKRTHTVKAQIEESKQVSSSTPVNTILQLEMYNNFICYVFIHSVYIYT